CTAAASCRIVCAIVWVAAQEGSAAPHRDSEQFRSAPKVPHASMRKHLRCQRATSRAFGDKRLFREVSKPEQLEIPVGLPRERAFVWQHRGPTNNSLSPIAANAPLRVTSRSDANFQKWKSRFRGSEGSEGSMRCLH